MIREFGLSIKFRWSGGGKKMKKRLVRGLVRAKNKKNWLSEGSDEQKTGKNGFPRPRMSRKRRKSTFGRGRRVKNDKNGENGVSATAETEKTPQTGFPTPWMSRKLKKLAFQPLG